nr:hypothetical protein [Tanacetum cinerariifolium]
MMSLTIYTSCIKQFWTTLKIKTVNDNVRLQALIDGKKVVITKASIRKDLKLNDAEGTSSLPNAIIFEELARMGYEKPSEKLTFYKSFFSPQWKFFIHTILQCLSAKTTSWNEFSSTMASAIICLTNNQKINFSKYIFDNLKKNLEAGVPLYMFPRFVEVFVNHQIGDMSHHTEVGDLPTTDQDTPIPDAPSSSQPQRKHKPKRKEKKERKETKISPTELPTEDPVPTPSSDPLPSGEDSMPLKELMVLCTNLSNKVLDLENEVIKMKSSHQAKITVLESRMEKLEEQNRSLTKELKNFHSKVESLIFNESFVNQEKSSKQGRKITDIDADAEVITTAKIIVDEVSTTGGELNAADEEPVSAAPTNITTAQLSEATKTAVDINTAPKAKGIVFHDVEKSTTRTASLKAQVNDKRKAKLVKEPKLLKSRKAQITIDEEVARRVEAKEDLEVLWKIVKDRFNKSQPKEVLDVFLWHTLKVMFEHSVEDNVWKVQKGPKGLARMYPLTNYTLQLMFNEVRLQVDYEVEVAYDLLRLVRKKLREGYMP